MVVESFRPGARAAIYERFRARGRMLPEGIEYVDSWVDLDGTRCFQLMRAREQRLLEAWIGAWSDLADFEWVPVQGSAEAARAALADAGE
jgi:hypothetical protein